MSLFNLARAYTATTGTGSVVVGAAVSGYLDWSHVTDGATVSYGIHEGSNTEVGSGTWTAATSTLARTTVYKSTNGDNPIVLQGQAQVYITILAEDITTESASSILTKLLTVDGAGSGLDADTLDTLSSSDFALVGHNHTGVYVPVGSTDYVSSTDTSWTDLTDGGATTLHTHTGFGDISGTGIVGQVAEFVTNTKTLQAANLIAPANLLTLVAGAPYTLTIPASLTVAGLGIANVFTTQQMVDGTSDQIQQRVQAHSTQTANIQTIENSSAGVLGGFDSKGRVFCYGNPAVTTNFFAAGAGNATLSGGTNIGIGLNVLSKVISGGSNVVIGNYSFSNGLTATNYNQNVAVGEYIAYNGYGGRNSIFGYGAGYGLTSATNDIFLGFCAGYRQTTASNLLIIDSVLRASAAVEQTNAILYGVMGATPDVQSLRVNVGDFTIGTNLDYDVVMTFLANTNSGVITWMEDEDYFRFEDDVLFNGDAIGFFGVGPVARATELTDELTTITHTAPGTPDYAIQDLTDTGGFGFATKDEGNTVLSVIANMQTRINEMETKLVAYGLFQDAD